MHSDAGLLYRLSHRVFLGLVRKNEFLHVSRLTAPFFNKKEASVLDVGVGDGFYYDLFPREYSVYGCDLNRSIHIDKLPYENFYCQDFLSLETNLKYDFITCFGVLEFIENKEEAFKKMNELLKTNGKVILLTPSWLNEYSIYQWMSRTFGKREVLPLDSHQLEDSPFQVLLNEFVFPHNELFILEKKKKC